MVLVTELMDGYVLVSGRGSSRELSSSREHIRLWDGPEAGRKGLESTQRLPVDSS